MTLSMRRNAGLAALLAIAAGTSVAATASATSGTTAGTTAATAAAGSGTKTKVIISTDLPLQGASADASRDTNRAVHMVVDAYNATSTKFEVEVKEYDDSTAAKGGWDDAVCAKNASDHVANADEVAVMGTYNSGCAKIIVPVLNQDPNGPMLMVSHANTNPGLTKTWDPGEPEIFYPTGKRNYARVVTTDDYQGKAAAQFVAQELKLKKCFVINDNQTYGQGVAQAFVDEAKVQNIEILGNEAWDAKQPNYSAFFEQIKATNPDCLYVGGIYDNNGGQLVKDKVKVLGDNTALPMMGPDGFTGYTDLQAQPEAEGMFLSFAGLDQSTLLAQGGAGADLVKAYKEKYGKDPVGSYPLYGVAAMQVILDAIAKSDGSRKSITDAVFSGEGITIPADKAVIGKEIKIDTASGDSNNRDISILQMTGGQEKLVKGWIIS